MYGFLLVEWTFFMRYSLFIQEHSKSVPLVTSCSTLFFSGRNFALWRPFSPLMRLISQCCACLVWLSGMGLFAWFLFPCVCHLYIRRLPILCFNFVSSPFTGSMYQLKEILLHSLASLWYRADVSYFIYLLVCVFSMETTSHWSHPAFPILRNCELRGVSLTAVLVSVLLLRWNTVTKSNLGNKVLISASTSWSQAFLKEEGQEFTAVTGTKELRQRSWSVVADWLAPWGPLSLLSYGT